MSPPFGPDLRAALARRLSRRVATDILRSITSVLPAILLNFAVMQCYGSLPSSKAITQYVHQLWQSTSGLPQDSVLALAQTADGYVWIGTEEGLVRFDGIRFRVYDRHNTPGLTSKHVSALLVDKRQNLWIGTHGGGLNCFCNGKVTALTSRNGLPSDSVNALYEDSSGTIWIGTDGGGLVRYRSNTISIYRKKDGLADDAVFSIAEDRHGTLWIGTHNGLSRFSENKFRNFTAKDGLGDAYVRSTLVDHEGNIWIGTNVGGLYRLNATGIVRYSAKNGLTSNTIFSLYEDRSGTLWIGTASGDLNRLIRGKSETFSVEKGFSQESIWSLLEDREGNLWVGTSGAGLTCLKDAPFTTISTREGLSSKTILPILEDRDGSLWIGSDRGIDHIAGTSISHYSSQQGLPDNLVFSLAQDGSGAIWAGTRHGVVRLRDRTFQAVGRRDQLPDEFVMTMVTDHNGEIWIGARGGLTHYDGDRFVTYTTKDGLSNNFVLSIFEDRQSVLWIGTSGGGLNKFSQGKFSSITTKDGLGSDIVQTVVGDEKTGVIWLGTNGGGLICLKDNRLHTFTSSIGLFDDNVMQVLDDHQGRLWMTSNRGVFWVSKGELEARIKDPSKLITSHPYGVNDGMKSKECNGGFQPAGLRSRTGELYFPTTDGVSKVNPFHLTKGMAEPLVSIEKMLVNGREVPDSMQVSRPVGKGKLDISFTAPSFKAPEKLEFRYLLEGFDKDWTMASEHRSAHYTNLPPGKYQFCVSARDPDRSWTKPRKSSVIALEPELYQTVWFRFLAVAFAGSMSFVIHRLRVRNLKANERKLLKLVDVRTADLLEREQELRQSRDELEIRVGQRTEELQQLNNALEGEISIRRSAEINAEAANRAKTRFLTNMSHELRTPINGIMGMTEITLSTELNEEQMEYQEVVRSSTADLLRIVDNILMFSKIDANHVTLDNRRFDLSIQLKQSCERYEMLARTKNLSFHLDIDPKLPAVVIGDKNRLSEILASLLDNALKFTNEGEVRTAARLLSTENDSCSVEFSVQDTGIGIAEKHQKDIFNAFSQADDSSTRQFGGTGLGLAISTHLVSLMGGRMWLKSLPAGGTTVYFSVSFSAVATPACDFA